MASSYMHSETETSSSDPPHLDLFPSLTSLREQPASYTRSRAWRSAAHSNPSLWRDLDRVQVLGDQNESGYGHTGCVNALSWSQDGETLISSGDDCRLCVWRAPTSVSSSSGTDEFTCSLTLQTGHTGNVFAAHFLPYTTHIATCAADRQVRVFDVTRTTGGTSRPMHVSSSEAGGTRERNWEERSEEMCCLSVLRCHKRKAKRIVTEDSPNFFLTVSEDHTVRQHDLRTSHTCGPDGNCPAPIVKLPYSLSTLACSPVTPWYFVVAGESAFGHLFDRRMVGRILRYEWGQNIIDDDEDENSTRCVRRFGRLSRGPKEPRNSSHVTAARMAKTNGHELLLSYSGDAAYLYNIRDTPFEPPSRQPSIVPTKKSPPMLPSYSHKKPPSPSTPTSSKKRRKLGNERPVSPTWAFAPTNPQGSGSGTDHREGSPHEADDNAPTEVAAATEWRSTEGEGGPSGSNGNDEEIPAVDLNDALGHASQTLDLGAVAGENGSNNNSEEEESEARTSEEDEDGDDRDGGEGDDHDEDADHNDDDDDNDDDDFVDPDTGEDDTEGAGYVEESNSGAAWDALSMPIVMPSKRFAGARNVETYKDVNFIGASDDYVCSGSDDGHFFLWSKATTELVGIWEGDGSVVNVVEDRPAHHSCPMLAVSGIDHTVKLFAPTSSEPRPFCHTSRAAEIIKTNSSRAAPAMMRLSRVQMALLQAHLGLEGGDINRSDCSIM